MKLKFTSIPIFIKEYRDYDNEEKFNLKYFSVESIRILETLDFNISNRGYRDIFSSRFENLNDVDKFIIDSFLGFIKNKTTNKDGTKVYVKELDLNTDNHEDYESFEASYTDELGDQIKISIFLESYNDVTYDISFMRE